MNEPKDGDFVAYVDALQRESAARLLQQGALHTASADLRDRSFETRTEPDGRVDVQAVVERFLHNNGDALLVRPLAAAVVGLVSLLVWLGHGGVFWLLVALVTLLYGMPRLVRALRAFDLPKSNRAATDQVFGKPTGKR